MKGKASDICTMCKHCEGLDMFAKMYSCKHYNNYPDSAIGMDCNIACYNFEEVNMNKVEGKVGDFCPKCKNCNVIAWKGVSNIVCEDPYDGMIKNLAADSDICCSMFEIRTEKKESCDKISLLQHELEMEKLRMKIHQLEKEKAAHLKGIERLKKSQETLQNQVKNLQTTNEESYKRKEKLKKANELAESWKRDYERLRDQFIYPIYNILYPDNPNIDINVIDLINDIKNLKVYSDENGTMYKDLQEWREKCIVRDIDVDRLLSKNKEKDKKISKLNQTISDQEITIKALLITIKEMCKEENENA